MRPAYASLNLIAKEIYSSAAAQMNAEHMVSGHAEMFHPLKYNIFSGAARDFTLFQMYMK